MSVNAISQRISFIGFLLGFTLTYFSPFKEYFLGFQQIFYSKTMSHWEFGIVWGLIFTGILFGGYSVLKVKGHWSLVALVSLLGLFYFIFELLSTGLFSGALY